jgi:L-cysteine S-thiosulfotransferase
LRPTLLQLLFTLTLYLIGCNRLPDSSKGFSLPQGNALAGVKIFLKYQCLACHCIEKFHYKTVNKKLETPMHLGVTSTRVMTYADLITSIINPHTRCHLTIHCCRLKQAAYQKMIVFNDVMTVNELVNLAKFLEPRYKIKPHVYNN